MAHNNSQVFMCSFHSIPNVEHNSKRTVLCFNAHNRMASNLLMEIETDFACTTNQLSNVYDIRTYMLMQSYYLPAASFV